MELVDEYGTEGPAVIDWLSCEAKAQNSGGTVRTGFRAIERGCSVKREQAEAIVVHAAKIGVLDDLVPNGRTFVCRISGWKAEQERHRAAGRQAEVRAKAAEQGSVT